MAVASIAKNIFDRDEKLDEDEAPPSVASISFPFRFLSFFLWEGRELSFFFF